MVPAPPYPVASTTLDLVDTSRPTVSQGHQVAPTRTLTTLVWRPAEPGRWPLVVFAHGFQVGPPPYEAMLEAWAAAGYVVAAPEFPLTDAAVAGADLDEGDIAQQPADVRFVLDSVVAPASPVAADIDPTRVVLAGHSDGAESVLAASTEATPPGQPAVAGVVAMSVQPLPGVATTANPPILVTQGDADGINPPSAGEAAFAAARPPRWYLDLEGGGHLPPLEAGSPWLPAVEATTEAFFAVVTGRGSVVELQRAADRPGLTHLTAG